MWTLTMDRSSDMAQSVPRTLLASASKETRGFRSQPLHDETLHRPCDPFGGDVGARIEHAVDGSKESCDHAGKVADHLRLGNAVVDVAASRYGRYKSPTNSARDCATR